MLHELIKLIHVDVCENLRREIPNGDSATFKKIRPRGCETFDHFAEKPHGIGILDPLPENLKQNIMINGIKEFPYVAFQRIALLRFVATDGANHGRKFLHAAMRPLADATGKRSRDKRFLENRIQNLKNRVMQCPVAYCSLMNVSPLRIMDPKFFIGVMPIYLSLQLAV